MIARRPILAGLTAAVVLAAPALVPQVSSGATPRTSLTAIWNDVMCVSCNEPLSVAQSDQAYRERAFIQKLVNQGYTKSQILRQLVAQYGPAVLGKPPARGFDLTVYLLPAAILLAGLATLAILLPRWRRRSRATAAAVPPDTVPPSAADSRRLDEELAHFES